ncbi:MAG: hypothetical protein ACM3SR_10075 [Ignavibacteriales bacterium]
MEATIQSNKYNKIHRFIDLLSRSQNLVVLKRLNPIFNHPEPILTSPGAIEVKYPNSVLEHRLRDAISDPSDPKVSDPVIQMFWGNIGKRGVKDTPSWIVVENIAVCYFYKIEDNINKPYAGYFLFKESPFYIQALAHPVIKQYKNSVVTISDDLPISISMRVNLHGENQREDVLSVIAHFLNGQELMTNRVNYIIRDKSISLREALDSVLKLTGVGTESSVSYCLTCGRGIDSGKKFCDARKYNYKNKNQCLIQFNYWLKARLGIKTTKSRSRMRNQFCKEMVELTKEFPLTAWDEFKRRHPKLYEKRYKERWGRERRLKR